MKTQLTREQKQARRIGMLLKNDRVKDAVNYAKNQKLTPQEFGSIIKKYNL